MVRLWIPRLPTMTTTGISTMSDLLASLIVANPQVEATDTQKESSSADHQATSQADSLVVHDVEAYLNDPKNKALMASSSKKQSISTTTVYGTPEPVQLGGPKTSHHVSMLHHLCQAKCLVPQFEIEMQADGGFGGSLRIGTETVYSHGGSPSKKEAKEALAEKGVQLVKGMVGTGKGTTSSEEEHKNWIGLLQEYHFAPGFESGAAGANYIEYSMGSSFACTCTIPGHDGVEFGSKTTGFASKKAARTEAAKEAVQFLIAQGLTNPDGTVKKKVTTPSKVGNAEGAKKKVATPGKVVSVVGNALEVNMDATYTQKVLGLCPILGLNQPIYRFAPSSPATPNLLSGAAYFNGEPLFPGPIGEVRNVFGKKGAKEESARGVWQVLLRLAKERGVEVEISSEEDENGGE